jgi:hypothetical protein
VKRELVISSDDLGMTFGINRGIEAACRARALTSTNFMVPCPWFEHAVTHFRHAEIDLGVHLTLTCEWDHFKWRPLSHGGSLLDSSGYLHTCIEDLMQSATPRDIEAECRQQIATALRRDLRIVYADLHMCIPVLEQDPVSGQPRVANPDHELALMRIVDTVAQEFGLSYPYALHEGRLRHFRSALSISGKSRSRVAAYLQSLEPGVHHLSCHCSLSSEEQGSLTGPGSDAHPWALAYRAADLDCITSTWFKDLLREQEIELVRMPFT